MLSILRGRNFILPVQKLYLDLSKKRSVSEQGLRLLFDGKNPEFMTAAE